MRDSKFWRTLDELVDDPAFCDRIANEFPSEIEAITDPVARRTFLKLVGASLGPAGVTACTRQPLERIVPYVRQPEELVPGKPLFFATAMTLGGVATGLLVESHEGRPTKIEGNPLHPGSLGATDVYSQAAILNLYDPDRSQTLTNLGEIRPWAAFLGAMRAVLAAQTPLKGAGLRVLTESVNSPTLAAQIRDLLTRLPSAQWHQWDPANRANAPACSKGAVGTGGAGGPGGSTFNAAAQKWIDAVAKDLQAHRGRSLVVAGDGQPASVHALAHAMNAALGNVGQTVVYTQSAEAEPVSHLDSLGDLVGDMNGGKVDILIILGGNPVYTAPVDLKFADAMNKVQ